MKMQERKMQLRDEEMGVVACVTNDGDPLFVSRQIAYRAATMTNQELVAIPDVKQIRLPYGASAVEAFQIETRLAKVLDFVDVFCRLQGRAIMCNVVRNELPEERPPCRDPRVLFTEMLAQIRSVLQRTR